MPEPVYLNARAEQCSIAGIEQGRRLIRYAGAHYLLVGLYFARSQDGQRDLFYILRALSTNGAGTRAPVSMGGPPGGR
ncbi:MAG: hypothetical protein QN122_10290 [Armatimonadota bacterium]|nr:hypothetical protein [Armatimonadota bacterium]MDR7448484.1 hypothetical protein [Armatimonadota bacterium]MDR7459115.1 hypothetical protein [Armatimonadota bacterium]MDR7479431.1 hypothetical protein [Armatimonadota bacterium]MDR7487473.1 hypothetical protein [Armatimonadota bacterium]